MNTLHTHDGNLLFTSAQVAAQLGISRPSLNRFLQRYTDLRPTHRAGKDFLWTSDEVNAVREAKAQAKPGRPGKTI